MDLVFFSPKPHTFILKPPSSSSFLFHPIKKFHSLRPLFASSSSKNVKIQCELNGSLSADFDARFVDRVLPLFSFTFLRLFTFNFTSQSYCFSFCCSVEVNFCSWIEYEQFCVGNKVVIHFSMRKKGSLFFHTTLLYFYHGHFLSKTCQVSDTCQCLSHGDYI